MPLAELDLGSLRWRLPQADAHVLVPSRGAQLVFDPAGDHAYLGGAVSNPWNHYNSQVLGRRTVWRLDLATSRWQHLDLPGEPLLLPDAIGGFRTVFDPGNRRILVFEDCLDDVFALDVSGAAPRWEKLDPAGDAPRACHRIPVAYDPVRSRAVAIADSRVFELGLAPGLRPVWRELNPAGTRAFRWQHGSAVYDQIEDRFLVVTNRDGGLDPNDGREVELSVQALDFSSGVEGRWEAVEASGLGLAPPPEGRPAHGWPATAFDSANNRLIVWGGERQPNVSQRGRVDDKVVHALNLADEPQWGTIAANEEFVAPGGTPSAIYDPGRQRLVVWGGAARHPGKTESGISRDVLALALPGGEVPPVPSVEPYVVESPEELRVDQAPGWQHLGPQEAHIQDVDLSADGGTLFAAAVYPRDPGMWPQRSSGIHLSTDGGASWVAARGDVVGRSITQIAQSPVDPQKVYAVGVGMPDGRYGAGAYVSSDAGRTWRTATGLPRTEYHGVEVDPSDPSVAWVWGHRGVFRTEDGGDSWLHATLGLGDADSSTLEAIPTPWGTRLFAAGPTRPGGSIPYRLVTASYSDDGGRSWEDLGLSLATIAADPADPRRLVGVGGAEYDVEGSVYRSDDFGETWTSVGRGGIPSLDFDVLQIDPSSGGQVIYGGGPMCTDLGRSFGRPEGEFGLWR
ncbi:MAG: glycoside hydrolase, partial [Actinomycetota bacterium]|nr:glycoside hydrolase [Actinomycetota bacterium]